MAKLSPETLAVGCVLVAIATTAEKKKKKKTDHSLMLKGRWSLWKRKINEPSLNKLHSNILRQGFWFPVGAISNMIIFNLLRAKLEQKQGPRIRV